MKKSIFFLAFCSLLATTTMLTACSNNDDDDSTSDTDPRFVGTWVRDASVSGVVEEVYTLVLSGNGSASYSWYRKPKASFMESTNHSSTGTWRYDATTNRIITDCTVSSRGATLIFDVVSVTSTSLVAKREGSSTSQTYNKK